MGQLYPQNLNFTSSGTGTSIALYKTTADWDMNNNALMRPIITDNSVFIQDCICMLLGMVTAIFAYFRLLKLIHNPFKNLLFCIYKIYNIKYNEKILT